MIPQPRKQGGLTAKNYAEANDICLWTLTKDADGEEFWNTSCGHGWELTEGNLEDNQICYCPFCGMEMDDTGAHP